MIYRALFKIKTQELPRLFLLAIKKKHFSARVMACTVQLLLRHDPYCHIKLAYFVIDMIIIIIIIIIIIMNSIIYSARKYLYVHY